MKSNKILTLRQIINWAQENNISLDTPVECYYGDYESHFEALGIVYETTCPEDENGDMDYDKFSEVVGEHCYCKDGEVEHNHIVITDGQHYHDNNKLKD